MARHLEHRLAGMRTRRALQLGCAVALLATLLAPSAVATGPEPTQTGSANGTPRGVTRLFRVQHATQQTNRWCVAASVQMALRQQGLEPLAQGRLYDQGLARKRCNRNVDRGLDPASWAWLLTAHAREGRSYRDVRFTSALAGTRAMVEQLYDSREVSGALVNRGHHAVVFRGATTSCDLSDPNCRRRGYQIRTVYVDDPWYGRNTARPGPDPDGCSGTNGRYVCGRIGLRPNAAISWEMWRRFYYTTWGNQPAACDYWNGYWVAVLRDTRASRSASAAPVDAGSDVEANDGHGRAGAGEPRHAEAPEPALATAASVRPLALSRAVSTAAVAHGLDQRPEFAPVLAGARALESFRVTSLDPSFPDYLLVPLEGRNGLRGVAMFALEDGGRPTFAGMTHSDEPLARFPAVPLARARALVAATGVTVLDAGELAWAPSAESRSPYYPFVRFRTSAGLRYVDSGGFVLSRPTLDP